MDKKQASEIQQKAHGTYLRNREIIELAAAGWNYARIGRHYKLSRQAVRAIVLAGKNGDK